MSLPHNNDEMDMTPQATSEPAHCLDSTPDSSSEAGESSASNPVPPAPHSNPAVNPQEMGGCGRIPRRPKAPNRPLAPFLRFCHKVRDEVKADNPDLRLGEIGKIIGRMWRSLSQAERRKFTEEYESEKIEYEEAMKTYYESPSYQAYSIAMSEAVAITGEETVDGASALTPSANVDWHVDIQPAEDKQDRGDGQNVRHVSRGWYTRNRLLLDEEFADPVVSDIQSMDANQQFSLIKRQMQLLTKHQKMLEAEFKKLEDKFEAKKMKFAEVSTLFYGELQNELRKVTAQRVNKSSSTSMVEEHKEPVQQDSEEKPSSAQEHLAENMSNSTNPSVPESNPTEGLEEDNNDATGPAPEETVTFVEDTHSLPPPAATSGQESQVI